MKFHPLSRLNFEVEKLLSYPGCDIKTLIMRKTIWFSTWAGIAATMGLTSGILIFDPKLTILINYGILIMIEIPVYLTLMVLLPHYFKKLTFLHICIMLLITFIFVLKLGGIAYSAGLIILGISFVLPTVSLQDMKLSGPLFFIYFITVLLSGILYPWLSVPEQMTHRANAIVFMLNILWVVPYVLLLASNFISQQKAMDELETKRLKELDQTRTKLFTNITHEFRTPLTVIQGMADLIKNDPKHWKETGTQKIKTNSDILLRLVNQMLDLAKIETGAMPVILARGNINSYLGYLVGLLQPAAVSRFINLKFVSVGNDTIMDFDPDKLMNIISNLVSNALKFTPEGGRVEVSCWIADNDKFFTIVVKDSGIGMTQEELDHIFERFYQGENGNNTRGSGLGLALAKEMAELLNGTITVKSEPGKGSEFTVILPVTRNAPPFNPYEQVAGMGILNNNTGYGFTQSQINLEFEQSESSNLPLLLIVEDNPDVVVYLQAILNKEYRVEVAINGFSGLEKAKALIPDIILSDVMMPEMDGFELLSRVKNDFITSHIPVVMLTAKADIDSRLAGLEYGADAYLAKPFNEKELHIQLKSLVELRKKFHERYASPDHLPEPSEVMYKKEDEFMVKVRKVLASNLDDENFGISQLCTELAMSHAQIYRKFKSLSNQSIFNYFKQLRLHKAHQLLTTTQLNITQVAFAVGFKNLSHFSREFTREFGFSPRDFRK